MRSVALAITWEMLHRSRWQLLIFGLTANLLPFFLESALSHSGPVDPNDQSQIIICVMLTQINMFVFGSAVISAQGNLARLYASPIPTPMLVACHLVPGMLLMGAQLTISLLAINFWFHLDWPIWGPVLCASVSLAAVNAVLWQTEKTAWLVLGLTTVAGGLGFWFKTRFGSLLRQPDHYWREVTPVEVLTAVVIAGVAYYAAIKGVARNRRGDTLRSLGIVEWINRVLDPAPEVGLSFKTPADAHFWYVWRQRGWGMPMCVVFGITFGFGIWLLANRNPTDLLGGFLAGGGMLSVVGFLGGILIGNCGPNDTTLEMGNYLATRPLTTRQMSAIMLKATVLSVLWSWGVWAVAATTTYLCVRGLGIQPHLHLQEGFAWWYIPCTIVGPWVVSGVGASLGLTGRGTFTASVIATGLITLFTGIALSELTLSNESQLVLGQACIGVLGVALVISTVIAYWAASHRSLIDSSAAYKAGLVWILLTIPVVAIGGRLTPVTIPGAPAAVYVLAVGIAALVVAPFSTIPLALAWNRIR